MPADAPNGPLRVLVVEDEYLVALEIEEMLAGLGYGVIGPAPTVARARALLERELPDLALLDVNLGGERSTPIAEFLRRRKIPFVIATGYDATQLPEPVLGDAPHISKPLDPERLRRALTAAGRRRRRGGNGRP